MLDKLALQIKSQIWTELNRGRGWYQYKNSVICQEESVVQIIIHWCHDEKPMTNMTMIILKYHGEES